MSKPLRVPRDRDDVGGAARGAVACRVDVDGARPALRPRGLQVPRVRHMGAARHRSVFAQGPEPGARRRERRGQDDVHLLLAGLYRLTEGRNACCWTAATRAATGTRRSCATASASSSRTSTSTQLMVREERRLRQRRPPGRRGAHPPRRRPRRSQGRWQGWRMGWIRSSGGGSRAAPSYRAANGRRWRWPARSCARTPTSRSSTSRRRRWTPPPSTRCSSASVSSRRAARRSRSRTRFPTVRMADRILVLEHGRVIEDGTHAELLKAGARYAELFGLQASGYR